jgi:hypothetical protein
MKLNGSAVELKTEWNATGERLYCAVTVQAAKAIGRAMAEISSEDIRRLPLHEITGIIAHGLIEVAMRQIMVAKMPVTIDEFGMAARLVYASCHQHQGDEGQMQ